MAPRDDGAERHAQELVDGLVVLVGHRGDGPDRGGQVLPREAPLRKLRLSS